MEEKKGLSPRTRGKRYLFKRRVGLIRSIPANAGETGVAPLPSPILKVYPRERGGNSALRFNIKLPMGLSPRTRGKHVLSLA